MEVIDRACRMGRRQALAVMVSIDALERSAESKDWREAEQCLQSLLEGMRMLTDLALRLYRVVDEERVRHGNMAGGGGEP